MNDISPVPVPELVQILVIFVPLDLTRYTAYGLLCPWIHERTIKA